MIKKIKKKIHELSVEHKEPHQIALGLSIGTFISILPTPGFNVIIGLIILFLYPKLNKVGLFLGLAIWNPFTAIPIYLISLKIGSIIFGNLDVITYEFTLWERVFHFTRRFLVGNLIFATSVSLLSYIITKLGMDFYKKKN
jgi:uncharacterized protein